MCCRVAIHNLAEFFRIVGTLIPAFSPRYNVSPGTPLLTLTRRRPPALETFRWGLAGPMGKPVFNARGETIVQKGVFSKLLESGRCIIPVNGFYEWRKEPGLKTPTPFYFHLASEMPMGLAGLHDGKEAVVITTAPNELTRAIHDRMPAIVTPENYGVWLDGDADAAIMQITSLPAELMRCHPVATRVNRAGYESPDCIAEAPTPGSLFE
jgi:putative SOS response-associated peptidase YedK